MVDELNPTELENLAFGVVQVDETGRVVRCNRIFADLVASTPDALNGCDLFRDVVPSAAVPSFRGRFLEGVRRGGMKERFRFVFGFETAPVLADIRMEAAAEPNRFWVAVESWNALSPSRQRSAALAVSAVERRIRAEPVDPGVCEREPIHVPGAVQPHAVLLVASLDDPALLVSACSENASDAVRSREDGPVIGCSMAELLPAPLVRNLERLARHGAAGRPVRPFSQAVRLHGISFFAQAHVQNGRLLLELERVAEDPGDFSWATPQDAQEGISLIRAAPSLEGAAMAAAQAIRSMTGFERVLVYRFDADWNGYAIAEDRGEGWASSLLGLRFPASDIPAQARALYARSPARFVVDRDAVPAALQANPAAANEPVDLTLTHARALSPVHLEYQRNMGVNGSMSVSILVDDALWGLVIGHHRRPHYVTPDTRALAGLVTDAFALRLHELETVQAWRAQQTTLAAHNRLLEQMARSDDFVSALTGQDGASVTLLDLFEAGGVVVSGDGHTVSIGVTPPAEALPDLLDWVRAETAAGERTVATEQLPGRYPPAEAWQEVASGLLAATVGSGPGRQDHVLVWFRPEVASSVAWGGDPNKPVLADDRTRTVLPRRSFERWVEERRGRADAWAEWQVRTAESLASAIEGVILRQSRRIMALEKQETALRAALEQKDVLAREVDHRVKNSLQIVANVMLMQGRAVQDASAKAAFEDTYARVMSVARVHSSLQQSEDSRSVDLGQTLRQLCDDLAAGMTGAEQRLDVQAEPGLMVPSQTAVALSLVATELVTNALRYAYAPGEQGEVEVSVRGRASGGVELRICDAGRGLPPDWSDRATVSAGRGGLGMRVIRAMLHQIGASMEVRPDAPGACFTVLA